MRRKASLILLAFAVFCVALAPLLRWYAFPRLAKVPPSEYQTMVLEAKDATLLDYASMKPKKVDKVSIVQTLKGNVAEAKKVKAEHGRDVVVWDAMSFVADDKGEMVSQIPERYIFDAHTQQPVNAKGEHVDGTEVKRDGIAYKWPFLTEKRDYAYFDMQTRTSAPIHYKGTQTIRGMEVYYFEQTIPWTKVPVPRKLPLGATPKVVKEVGLERWYTTKRMFWIEPLTGAPLNGEEIHIEEMRWTDEPDKEPLTAFDGHVKMRQDFFEANIDLVRPNRQLLLIFRSYAPLGLVLLGGALFALALLLEARSRRPAGPAEPESGPDTGIAPEPARA